MATNQPNRPETRRWARTGSTALLQALEGCRDDAGKPGGGRQPGKLARAHPARLRQFLVEAGFAGEPARGERQDDEMALDTVVAVARDGLAEARQRHRL